HDPDQLRRGTGHVGEASGQRHKGQAQRPGRSHCTSPARVATRYASTAREVAPGTSAHCDGTDGGMIAESER
ncbi:MAG: hypothetical protein ACRDRO_28910, partial [Pseudonocardiaceae bacterium]